MNTLMLENLVLIIYLTMPLRMLCSFGSNYSSDAVEHYSSASFLFHRKKKDSLFDNVLSPS